MFNKSSQEYFTRYSHTYTDTIKPILTDTQRDVCDIVIRFSVGYNRESAYISNSTFAAKSGKSVRAIITAKQQLIKMGVLILLQQAFAYTPALYALDIYYNDPNRSFKNNDKAVNAPQLRTIPTEDILPVISATANLSDNTPELLSQDDTIIDTVEDISEYSSEDDDLVTIPELSSQDDGTIVDIIENIPEYEYTSEEDSVQINGNNSDGEYSQTANGAVKSVHPPHAVTSPLSTEISLGPYRFSDDLNTSTNKQNKQTEETPPTKIPNSTTRDDIKNVCYNYIKLFPEDKEDRNGRWRFIGWAVKNYGVEACLSKLEYIREYKKLYDVANPRGLFRTALMKDYMPGKWITGMIKGRRKADADIKRTQESIAEITNSEANTNWEANAAKLQDIIAMLEEKERLDG